MGMLGAKASSAFACALLLFTLAPGPLLADYIEEFPCEGVARHIFKSTKVKLESVVPVDPELDPEFDYKKTEHYCQLPNDNRQGFTKITFRVYKPQKMRIFIWGQYANGQRRGKWAVTDARGGMVIDECFYANGILKRGGVWCER